MVSTGGWQIMYLFFPLIWALRVHGSGRTQPIGIDLGSEIVTASYAYSPDNVTTIATVAAGPDSSYRDTMIRLRLEYMHDHPSPFAQKPAASIWKSVWSTIEPIVSSVEPYLPYLDYVGLSPWLGVVASSALYSLRATARTIDGPPLKRLTAETIQKDIGSVLIQLIVKAREDHDIRIKFALFSAPSFFNSTLTDIVVRAARDVGIRTTPMVVPRTLAPTYQGDSRDGKAIRYLVLDQGEFHCDVQTVYTGDHKRNGRKTNDILMPMEPFSSVQINRRLADKLVSGSKAMQRQIARGANRHDLWQIVRKARFLIRDNIDAELMGEGTTEDHHLDEYPLDMQGWGDGTVQAVLKWEDVQEEEAAFVKTLGQNLLTILIAAKGMRHPETYENQTPEQIDRVVILASHYDGQLVKQAVQSALGESVEIMGGTLHEYQLAAKGLARLALRIQKQKLQPGQCEDHDEL